MALTRIDGAALQRLLRSPTGPVARELLRRGEKVVSRAKSLCPVASGRLRNSITPELVETSVGPVVRVGTNVEYARFVHDGTGIYGPRAQRIEPTRTKVFKWKAKGAGAAFANDDGYVIASSTAGMRGVPFLRDALGASSE